MVKVRENLVGKRYGRLTVIKQAEDYITPSTQKHRAMWQCVCDCGNLVIASKYDLQRNSRPTVSCGCFSRESASERMHDITHKKINMLFMIIMLWAILLIQMKNFI